MTTRHACISCARRGLLALVALIATACGGGGAATQHDEDSEASSGGTALIALARSLIDATSDAAEPRSLADLHPPVDDTGEPEAL